MRVRSLAEEKEVIDTLLNQYESVFKICLGFSQNFGEAEELMQETYLRALRRISSLHQTDHAQQWIFKIARNTCLNHLRKRRLEKLLSFL